MPGVARVRAAGHASDRPHELEIAAPRRDRRRQRGRALRHQRQGHHSIDPHEVLGVVQRLGCQCRIRVFPLLMVVLGGRRRQHRGAVPRQSAPALRRALGGGVGPHRDQVPRVAPPPVIAHPELSVSLDRCP
eukprot:5569667-Pyramimonas_sp.AAC.1